MPTQPNTGDHPDLTASCTAVIHHQDADVTLWHGDSLDVLAQLPDCSVDSVATDPPYELGFMGKAWDGQGIAYNVELWRHAHRVLKPGGHLLAFGGTRTWHRLAVAIEREADYLPLIMARLDKDIAGTLDLFGGAA